jgi:hypothetical protein
VEKTYGVVVHRASKDVSDCVTDPFNIPSWAWCIDEVRLVPPGPIRVGSEIHQTVRGREAVWKVTAFAPSRLCVYEADY